MNSEKNFDLYCFEKQEYYGMKKEYFMLFCTKIYKELKKYNYKDSFWNSLYSRETLKKQFIDFPQYKKNCFQNNDLYVPLEIAGDLSFNEIAQILQTTSQDVVRQYNEIKRSSLKVS
jgi:hypothetical protein